MLLFGVCMGWRWMVGLGKATLGRYWAMHLAHTLWYVTSWTREKAMTNNVKLLPPCLALDLSKNKNQC